MITEYLGLTVKIDDEDKTSGVIIGECTYSPSWAQGEVYHGYIVEVDSPLYNTSSIVVHKSNVLIKE